MTAKRFCNFSSLLTLAYVMFLPGPGFMSFFQAYLSLSFSSENIFFLIPHILQLTFCWPKALKTLQIIRNMYIAIWSLRDLKISKSYWVQSTLQKIREKMLQYFSFISIQKPKYDNSRCKSPSFSLELSKFRIDVTDSKRQSP